MSLRFVLIIAILSFAAACSSNYSTPPTSPTPAPAPAPGGSSSSVAIPAGAANLGNRAFVPDEIIVTAGATVTWMNTDSEAHTSVSNAAGWRSGIIAPGAQFSASFPTAGQFSYHCEIHPGMVGTVVVR